MGDKIIYIGAVFAAFGVVVTMIIKGVAWVLRTMQRLGRMTDDFLGRPESAPGAGDGRPGVLSQLGTLNKRVERVEYQLHPNGGGSVADTINKIDRKLGDGAS